MHTPSEILKKNKAKKTSDESDEDNKEKKTGTKRSALIDFIAKSKKG